MRKHCSDWGLSGLDKQSIPWRRVAVLVLVSCLFSLQFSFGSESCSLFFSFFFLFLLIMGMGWSALLVIFLAGVIVVVFLFFFLVEDWQRACFSSSCVCLLFSSRFGNILSECFVSMILRLYCLETNSKSPGNYITKQGRIGNYHWYRRGKKDNEHNERTIWGTGDARGGRGHGPEDLILFLGGLVTDFPAKEMSKHAVPLGPGDRHGTGPR